MQITFETISKVPKNEQGLLLALYKDLTELNTKLHKNIFIWYEDTHTEYSPERCDPCSDYYGTYILCTDSESIGNHMTLEELDSALLLLWDFVNSVL